MICGDRPSRQQRAARDLGVPGMREPRSENSWMHNSPLLHGWGHKGTGTWRPANRAGGPNVNRLTSSAPEDVESLSGTAWLTGVPVRVDRVAS